MLTLTGCQLMILLSLFTAALGHFFQYCQQSGEIFSRYGLWLNYHWIHSWRKKHRWKRPLLKVAGLCVFCNSTWINIGFFLLVIRENATLIPLSIGLNYVWVKILSKL